MKSHTPVLIATLCGIAVLCAGRVSAQNAPAPSETAGVPNAIWPDYYYDTFDRVSKAVGLKTLRAKTLPPGAREARIWISVSTGVPKTLYRFVERGGEVSGEVIDYWSVEEDPGKPPGQTMHDLLMYSLKGSCKGFPVRAGTAICRAVFDETPKWRHPLARAGEAGLWTLLDESTLPDSTITIDGWTITVELLKGDSYRAYQYDSPTAQDSFLEVRQAARLAGIVQAIQEHRRRPDNLRNYRGVTTGSYQSSFHLCGSEKTWGFKSVLERLAKEAGVTLPESGPAGYKVEIVAEATPKWLARDWESKYTRVLQPRKLVSVRPAQDSTCTGPTVASPR